MIEAPPKVNVLAVSKNSTITINPSGCAYLQREKYLDPGRDALYLFTVYLSNHN
jgi:hypothetical protein